MEESETKIVMVNAGMTKEKMAMVSIIISLQNFTDPVAMQSISDAALQRKKELEEKMSQDVAKM